jgi:chromate transporter
MMSAATLNLGWSEWLQLLTHYMTLSLLAVGGAISTAPDMHRFLVDQNGWLSDRQFNESIALAQSAPGPNVLFVALMGWNVGLNAGGLMPALLGLVLAMVGLMLPSSTLTYMTARWSHENRNRRGVRAFKQGMAPIVIALLIATGWILASAHGSPAQDWPLWLTTFVTTIIVWRTKLHLLWLLAAGAALGWFGFV